MQDIRKPYSRSKSNRDIGSRVEAFENNTYDEEMADEGPVHIPARRSFKERRSVDSMDVFPSRGRRSYDSEEETAHPPAGRRVDDGMVHHDPRTRYIRKRESVGTLSFVGIMLTLLIGGGLLTFVFNKATITIVPKYEDLTDYRSTITLAKEGSDTEGTVLFKVATTSLHKSKALALSETKKVEAKASGRIVIYNNYSSEPQRLIKNTRFESSAGKIYRINQSVTVPGKSRSAPGSVEVTVYADDVGASFNSPPTDFTIPGFKGLPQYGAFYARSNGPLSGGASGNASLASLADINAAKDELALELARDIEEKLSKTAMEGYIGLYDNAIDIIYEDNEEALLRGEASTYEVTATGFLMLAEKNELAKAVAQTGVRDYKGEPVRLDYADKIIYTKKDTDKIPFMEAFDLLAEGNPRIVYLTDETTLKTLFLGKDRSEFNEIMRSVTTVESAEISFSPLWLSTFPEEPSRVSVIESLPKR